MHAVVDATGHAPRLDAIDQHRPSPLYRIVDKPIIFHALDQLARYGVTHCELVRHHFPEKIENAVSTGKRWGIEIEHSLCRDPERPFIHMSCPCDKPLLLGRVDRLAILPDELPLDMPIRFLDENGQWTGWAIIPPGWADNVEHALERGRQMTVDVDLDTTNPHQILMSNIRALEGRITHRLFPTSARNIEPGIWISSGVSIHPTAKITAPAFIGEHCQIDAHANIGPHVVLENRCLISKESSLSRTVVAEHSFVGEGLHLDNVVVDGNNIVSLTHETTLSVEDDFIASHLRPQSFAHIPAKWLERIIATLLFTISLPLLAVLWFVYPPKKKSVIQLPCTKDLEEFYWTTLSIPDSGSSIRHLLNRLPTLAHVVSGKASLFGLSPHTRDDYEQMPKEWQLLIRRSKIGVINILDLEEHQPSSQEQWQMAQAYYGANCSYRFDLGLACRWLKRRLSKGHSS